jgi:hypothetical protein
MHGRLCQRATALNDQYIRHHPQQQNVQSLKDFPLHTMSPASSSPRNKNVTICQHSMDLPPLLRLPVELRYLIYSYATDEQKWFAPESEQVQPLSLGQNRFDQRHFRDNGDGALFQQHKAFLTTNTSDAKKPQLTCAHPTARVNKQLRIELSEFLRTSSMPIVSRVRDFDFSHVHQFLSTLEDVHQDKFKLRHNGSPDRKLTIELQGQYTTTCMGNLQRWIEYVDGFVGPDKLAELASLYKPIDSDHPKRVAAPLIIDPLSRHFDDDFHRRIPITVLKDILEYHDGLAPGGGEIEVHKIMRTLYCWLGSDWMFQQDHVDILKAVWIRFGASVSRRYG